MGSFVQRVGLTKILIGILVLAAIGAVFIIQQKSTKGDGKAVSGISEFNPAFANYINSFTSGVISTGSGIAISFEQAALDSFSYEHEADEDLFDFSPSIKGKAYWVSDRTIEFRPEGILPYGENYEVSFALDKVFKLKRKVPKKFEFGFRTLDLNVEMEISGLSFKEEDGVSTPMVIGSISSSDVLDSSLLVDMLNGVQEERKLEVSWTHSEDQTKHYFEIAGIERSKQKSEVGLSYSLNYNGSSVSGKGAINIPAIGEFVFLSGRVLHSPDQYISIRFSDPVDRNFNIRGLIQMEGADFDYEVDGNQIKIFPTTRQAGARQVQLLRGIRSVNGDKMDQDYTYRAVFEQMKPAVRWIGDGNIVPSNNGVFIPFEAVALQAVDVEVIKVFEDNIVQFFQRNQLPESEEMIRVARPVARKTISLQESGIVNLNRWNRYSLDLSDLVQTEPGAIYNVKISFRMQQSLYQCAEGDSLVKQDWKEGKWDEVPSYYGGDYYDYYWEDYDYRERENPCHVSYYQRNASGISKNVLASDIGIIAKKGAFNNINLAITNLKTTEPIAGAQIEVYNLQQRVMATSSTNQDGLVQVDLESAPFMVVVKHNSQYGYLRLDNKSNLSLSHFNTSGATTQGGFKGFIYGERGVWRPGDSLFVTFMLQDEEKLLPDGHPIVFELKDPMGKVKKRLVKNSYADHVYAFKTKTAVSDPTGLWMAQVSVGDFRFSKSLPIETIKPNRLKINLDFGVDELTAGQTEVSGELSARWLHGAIAKNMDAKIEATLYPVKTTFEEFENYHFDDDARSFQSESKEVYTGQLNEKGVAQISVDLAPEAPAPGKLKAKLKTTVTEKGGNSSIDIFDIPYHPFESYVGIKPPKGDRRGWLLTDTDHEVNVVCVDPKGKLLNTNRNLQVELWKVSYRWWWDQSSDNLSNYVYSDYRSAVSRGTVELKNGKGVYKLNISRPQWGRFYLKVTDPITGHVSGTVVYVDWPSWAGKPNDQSGTSVLEFTPEKDEYVVGDKTKVKIPLTPAGKALVSLESGSKVLKQFWVNTKEGSSEFEFDVTEEMAPNVYVHITQLQPHGKNGNDLPIRLYGIANINVKDPFTLLKPTLKMPDVLAPEEQVKLEVSEATGRAMTYTIAIVDEGLLDLTRFKTPHPWNAFYQKQALGVSSYDMYKYVMGSAAGELNNVLGIGGDLDGKSPDDSKLNRFKAMVKFIGPFKLNAGATDKHEIKIPYYVGSVRTMIIAREEGAYGHTEKTTPVRKPLMVLSTLPRVLSPNEEVLVPVSAFAMEEQIKSAKISIEVNGMLNVLGSKNKSVTFPELGEQMAFFKVKVGEKIGKAVVTITAKSGKEIATDKVELLVRAPNPPVTRVYDAILEPNAELPISFATLGIEGTNSGVIEVSSIPPLELEKRLKYLMRYPHGCVEQTTSSVFPQLFLSDIMELSNEQKALIDRNVKAGISRLLSMQVSSGGFGYWPGALVANEWGSNYAGHFLVEAQKKGYDIPNSAMKKWRKFQNELADAYKPVSSGSNYYKYNNGLNQAYRLYTLASFNTANIGAMNRLRLSDKLSASAQWRLAAAYSLAGQADIANKLITGQSTNPDAYTELSGTFGSHLRDQAMILETLVEMGNMTKATQVLQGVSEKIRAQNWWSTQTTAYCLLAAAKYAKLNRSDEPIDFDYAFAGAAKRNASTKLPLASVKMSDSELRSGKVSLSNKQSSSFYVQVTTTGQPLVGDTINFANDLNMDVRYYEDGKEIEPTTLDQGTTFEAVVTITNPGLRGNYEQMALTQMFPSGWEIINTRFEGTARTVSEDRPTYRDIRDDRVLTYFDIGARKTVKFRVKLTASYGGRFYLPTTTCSAMYDNTINAAVAGKWIYVTTNVSN